MHARISHLLPNGFGVSLPSASAATRSPPPHFLLHTPHHHRRRRNNLDPRARSCFACYAGGERRGEEISTFQSRGAGVMMRFRFRNKEEAAAGDGNRPESSPNAAKFAAAVAGGGGGGGGGALVVADESPDQDSTRNGSKDESFFEARPWLDSDSEDDFHSVRGDFTPSRGTTPDHQRLSPFTGRISVDRSEPSLIEKKQRLLELLQEKQQYDDDSVADVGSEIENGAVHAEEYLKSSRKGARANRASKAGCFPSSFWKIKFRSCRKKRKEPNDKLN